MKAFCRRFSTNATSFTHQGRPLPEGGLLTRKERDQISALPFFIESSHGRSRTRRTSTRQEYLEKKLPDVRRAFGCDPDNPGYLPFKLPKERPNPYWDAHLGRTVDPDTGKQTLHGKPRLSVTKLLTKRWCELRESYDIYAKAPIYEHPQVIEGLETHQKLEDETHRIPEDWHEFMEHFEVAIPTDEYHELVGSWYESIGKLVNLFTVGEAREVLCHGFLDPNSCQMVEGPVVSEEEVLVSGVIDHLVLTRRARFHGKPLGLIGCIESRPNLYIADVLNQIEGQKELLKQKYGIVLSDIKTRSIRKIPTQNSVVKSTKLQVMYYRSFLETLGSSPSGTYQRLLLNAQRRKMDIDRPIEPSKLISMMAATDLIISDMRCLRDGENIGFETYDGYFSGRDQGDAYDVTHFYDLITDVSVIQKFEEFFTLWSRPPTLRYFAARLAQMYHEVAPLLSDTLLIEYYCQGENFHNIVFDYDPELMKSECFNSASFWFGKRDIEPIKPTLKNVMTYCKHCDYEEVCLWRKQITDKCRQLGSDLEKITEE
ncbi:hypothetical protein HG536_0H01230 [Torulaspora globosa]|uniref:Exonuclease V, mitochondrial n=1 Tax=Torulaspora globosa TaxID=48254 RepID=A0A7G3ZML2_9SACH|nr:uncharacterized protein HG536_0H01230 [Torulaspora globosa]QLL34748.1 hypothetical protein HG536_0H01230 [Torulaspora globosa]